MCGMISAIGLLSWQKTVCIMEVMKLNLPCLRAISLYEEMLMLVHPFMPFITEEIWQLLDERKSGESISIEKFPKFDEKMIDETAEKEIFFVQEVVTAIRNIRGEMNISPAKPINVFLKSSSITNSQERYIKTLVRIDQLTVEAYLDKPKACASAVVKGCDIFIPLEGLIDLSWNAPELRKRLRVYCLPLKVFAEN